MKQYLVDRARSVIVWLVASVVAIVLVEYEPLAGLVFALVAGVGLGILSFRGERA